MARSHFIGLVVAILLVLVVSSLLFRSLLGGFLALLPVAVAVRVIVGVRDTVGGKNNSAQTGKSNRWRKQVEPDKAVRYAERSGEDRTRRSP